MRLGGAKNNNRKINHIKGFQYGNYLPERAFYSLKPVKKQEKRCSNFSPPFQSFHPDNNPDKKKN